MSEGFEKLNKQIASFMLLSLALSAPVMADNVSSVINSSSTKIDKYTAIPKYAAPQYPIGQLTPIKPNPPAILKYGAPQMPIEEITPVKPEFPIISMYAAPQFPIEEIKPLPQNPVHIIAPMYAAPELPIKQIIEKKQDINNSLMNIEKNTEKIQKPVNFDNSAFLNKSDIVKTSKNLDKIGNIAKNPDKTATAQASRVQAGEFIYTNYGSYRTIEPLSYSFFK